MSALTAATVRDSKSIKAKLLPLAAGAKAFRNGMACLDTANAVVKPGQASTTLVNAGVFEDDYDNSGGGSAVLVQVRLHREIFVQYFDSVTGSNAVTAANLFADCYIADDHTVTMASSGNSKAGRVWEVDPLKGVAVESYGSFGL